MSDFSEKEKMIHTSFYIDDLNDAWVLLQDIKPELNKNNKLLGAAFSFALIKYARPFKKSNGVTNKKHNLPESFVPKEYKELHSKIIKSRDKILAHKDLDIFEPTYSNGIICKNIVYETQMLEKIDNIISLIEKILDKLYENEVTVVEGHG